MIQCSEPAIGFSDALHTDIIEGYGEIVFSEIAAANQKLYQIREMAIALV